MPAATLSAIRSPGVLPPPVTLPDIQLRDYTLANLPRLSRLRAALLSTSPEICIERARWVTRFLCNLADPAEPLGLSYARAVGYCLNRKAPLFPDDNLLAGTTTSKLVGAPVYPELTGMSIWPELDTISTRQANPLALARDDAQELDLTIFPFWMERNLLEVARARMPDHTPVNLFQRLVFFLAGKAGAVSHTIPGYDRVLERGVLSLIDEAAEHESQTSDPQSLVFYQGVQVALQGVLDYATHLRAAAESAARHTSDPTRRAELTDLAQVCARVPAYPARSFREAINALWLLQIAVHTENINMAISPGRLDQVLYPWYRADVDAGRLEPQAAIELIGCLWLKLNDNTNVVPEAAQELFGGAGTVPAVTLGGVGPDGRDAVNDLTYLMLRVTELLRTRDPSVNARFHADHNERRYRDRLAEVISTTKCVPAIHNDDAVVRTLTHQGVLEPDARDWAVIGCVELGAPGRSYDSSSSIILNLVSALELALHQGKRPFTGDEQLGLVTPDPATLTCFEDFWAVFETQLRWLIGQAISLNEALGRVHQERMPSALLSALYDGPMESGRDLIWGGARYNSSGVTHVGFADTVDSLAAVQAAVFDEHRCTFAQLLQAIRTDFTDAVQLHTWLVHRAPKYGGANGTDSPAAALADRLLGLLYDIENAAVNYRGGHYRPAYWSMTNHVGQGRLTGALPNGRREQRSFASGITPVSQEARDLGDCLDAVARLDARHIPGGEALNIKFPSLESSPDVQRLGALVEGYFRQGGMHLQCNVMSYAMLLEAKAHPERHPDLLVRVSGYSAFFNDLNDAMKDEIITRTAYELRTGVAADFPSCQKRMLPSEASRGDVTC